MCLERQEEGALWLDERGTGEDWGRGADGMKACSSRERLELPKSSFRHVESSYSLSLFCVAAILGLAR